MASYPTTIWNLRVSTLLGALLKEGLRWQVGYGKSIDIWRDDWIPGIESNSLSPPTSSPCVLNVSDLIHPINKIWKSDLVLSLLEPVIGKQSLSIGISKDDKEDQLVWQFNRDWTYFVRSDYLVESKNNIESLTSKHSSSFIVELNLAPHGSSKNSTLLVEGSQQCHGNRWGFIYSKM